MLSKSSNFNLINAANVASGLLKENLILNENEFFAFDWQLKGLPILIEADHNVFDFSNEDVFELDPVVICEKIYGHRDLSYIGFKHAFQTNKFLSNYTIKTQFCKYFKDIVKQNRNCVDTIQELKSVHKKIGAFQTRNIPHMGHEAIIRSMLQNCSHVVINPVMGPKKKGDIRLDTLELVFQDLATRKYNDSISFCPIIANMFYAGPREALHHAIMRQNIGFNLFSVGRDHAGADGVYKANAATDLIKQCGDKLNIYVMCHDGAVYCSKCEKVLIREDCNCENEWLQDIAGTEFRKALTHKRIYPLADEMMQKYIMNIELEIFEE
jgi:sulfate adenylyltransferase